MYPGEAEKPKMTAGQAEMEGETIVARCDARTCLFNQARRCSAGTVDIAFTNGMAQCATFTPRNDAMALTGEFREIR